MAFERLLRLTKKCPGYVVSGLRNASGGIATVTQKLCESQYYITRALFGTRSLFAMTPPVKFACARGSGNQIGATGIRSERQGSDQLAEEGRPSPGPSPEDPDTRRLSELCSTSHIYETLSIRKV